MNDKWKKVLYNNVIKYVRRYIIMIIVLRPGVDQEQAEGLRCFIRDHDLDVQTIMGTHQTVIGVVGDSGRIDANFIESLDIVESVKKVTADYRLAGRLKHPEDSVYSIGGAKIGGGNFALIAGPCSVESRKQILDIANAVRDSGATMLRGGAFKPRTSPYDFQGLREDGIKLLLEARKETGLPIVTEIMSTEHLTLFEDVDVIQVGARNMQNFELLKELSKLHKPILLKRGWSNTVKELLTAAEYIMTGGNEKVILCERGIRTFETATRNTLDLSAIPVIKEQSHLPVIVDPSHATGHTRYVEAMALAAAAAGADGLMIEVHNDPAHAKCDGPQAVTTEQFAEIARKVFAVRKVI